MDFTILPKPGARYIANDTNNKTLYTVRKRNFGSKYDLFDKVNYNLYTFGQTVNDKKPAFTIILNDNTFMRIECKSLFLDPTLICKNKSITYELVSKDRKNFDIIVNKENVGHIYTKEGVTGDLVYDLSIDNRFFDDYVILFAVAIDKAFGEFNKDIPTT